MDSRRVSRAPRYSGVRFESRSLSPTRLSRSMASLSSEVRLMTGLVTLLLRILQPPHHLIEDRISTTLNKVIWVWAVPSSLATTIGIEVSFFSFRY